MVTELLVSCWLQCNWIKKVSDLEVQLFVSYGLNKFFCSGEALLSVLDGLPVSLIKFVGFCLALVLVLHDILNFIKEIKF